jgi:TP901 family phage tail tape measure protein
MSQSIQLQVTQVGLEQSIAAAMKRVGSSSQINLGTSSKQINALSQPLGRITGQADEFSKSMAAANARVLAFGASAGIIAGVSSAMSGLLSSTIKVEKSLVEISTVLNKTGSELDEFGQDIFNVAKNTGKSFDEVAKGALELARQGLNAEDTLARLNDALILSRLSGLDAAQSVEGLTAAFNSFKSSGITTAEILNKVVAAAQKYSVSEKDIIEGLKRSASVANLAGVSFEELAAVITAVQEKTARGGAVIGNAFKTIFSRIQDKAVLSDLQDMRVGVTDLQGDVLPALKILENLAKKMEGFSQIEQADIAKKLGGVYQLDKLLAALSDLSDKASVTTGALKEMGEAGDSAYKKNAILNETLAALLNKVTVSAEQLGAKLGEIGVTDSLKNVLGFFNSLLEGMQKILGQESGLGDLVRGLVKGLGSFLAGPGLALFGGIILKLSKDLVQFGFASLKAFFGIGKAAKEVQNVEGAISQILSKNVNLQQQLFALEGNRAGQLRLITGALVEQEAVLRRSANISSGLAAPLYNVGARAKDSGLRIGNSAGGYMPAVAQESKSIQKGVGGARAGDKPVVMPNFNFGGGKKGTMVAHTGEYVVPNFNGSGGSAVFNRRMVQSMGLPSGAKKIGAAGGFVPNFVNEADKQRNPKGLGASTILQSIGFQGDESYDEIFKKIQTTYKGSEVKWVNDKKNAFNIFQNRKSLTSQAIPISAVEKQRNSKELKKGESVYDARQQPNSAVMLIPQNSPYNSTGLNVAFKEKRKVGGKIYDRFIGGIAGIQENLSDTDEIKFSKISKIDQSLREGLSTAAFNILNGIQPGIKLEETSELLPKNIEGLLEKGGAGAFGALKGALFEGIVNKVAEAKGRNFKDSGSLDIDFKEGGEKSRTILETIFGLEARKYDFADFKNSRKSKDSYIDQVINYLPKDKSVVNAAGGFVPNFASMRSVGYLDGDVLSDPQYADIVKAQIQKLGIKGGVAEYHKYLGSLASKARTENKIKKFTSIFGVPGAGKSTMMLGGGNRAIADNATLRKTNRIPILTPEDIYKVSEIVDTRASVGSGTMDALQGGYLSNVDKMTILSTSTKEEQLEVLNRRKDRDEKITKGISDVAFGRSAGTSTGAPVDSAFIEALALSILGPDKVRVMGIQSGFKLKRKKGSELPMVEEKRIGLAYGAFSPSTKGHAELLNMARASGIPAEDFIAAVSKEGGRVDPKDPHSWRTALFPQGFRKLLAKKTFAGANVIGADPNLFQGGIPSMLEVDPINGQRSFIKAGAGSMAFVGSDKTEKDLEKYIKSGYQAIVGERTEGISGTSAREAIMGLNNEAIAKIFTKDAMAVITEYLPQLKNRSDIFPEILNRTSNKVDKKLLPAEAALAQLPSRITPKVDPATAEQILALRETRDKMKKLKEKYPSIMLKKLGKLFPSKYGLPSAAGGFVPNFANPLTDAFGGLKFAASAANTFRKTLPKGSVKKAIKEKNFEPIFGPLLKFFQNPNALIKSNKDLENAKKAIKLTLNSDLIREAFAKRIAPLISSQNYDTSEVFLKAAGGISEFEKNVEGYAKYKLFGGTKNLSQYAPEGIKGLVEKGKYLKFTDPGYRHKIAEAPIGGLEFKHVTRRTDEKGGYYSENYLLGGYTGRVKEIRGGKYASYKDRWDVDLQKSEKEFLRERLNKSSLENNEYFTKFISDPEDPYFEPDELDKELGANTYGAADLNSFILRELVSAIPKAKPAVFKGVVPMRSASGFIPNFAQKSVRVENMYGEQFRRYKTEKGSFLDFQLIDGQDESTLSIDEMRSKKKGEAFELFKRLAKLSKRTKIPIYSNELISQVDRKSKRAKKPVDLDKMSNWDELIYSFPQLRYRQIPGLVTSGRFGTSSYNFETIDELKKLVTEMSKKDFRFEMRYGVDDLTSKYAAGGFVPNFAGGTPNRATETAKALLQKLKSASGAAKTLAFDQFLNAVLPQGISPIEQGLVQESLTQVPDAAKAAIAALNNEFSDLAPANNSKRRVFNSIVKDLIDLENGIPLRPDSYVNEQNGMIQGVVSLAKIQVKRINQQARRNIGDSAAKGFLPNFANPLQAAVGREIAAGVPASQIYIDRSPSLKNAANPMGLMVANRRDEPAGGFQGISRARREGANPMMYGAAGGFVPNYAAAPLANKVESSLGGSFSVDVKNAINDFAKKASVAGSDMDALAKVLKQTLKTLGNSDKASKAVAEESKKQFQEIKNSYAASQQSRASKILESESNKKLAKQLDKVYLEYNKSQKTKQDLTNAEAKAAAILQKTQLGAVSQRAITASTKSLAENRTSAQVGAGGNRDMLGTIFAVQGAFSALTGATEGATEGFGLFANTLSSAAGTATTAIFASQGLATALPKFAGVLGPAGIAIGGITAAYQIGTTYFNKLSGITSAVSVSVEAMGKAAEGAAISLSTVGAARKEEIKKRAKEIGSDLSYGEEIKIAAPDISDAGLSTAEDITYRRSAQFEGSIGGVLNNELQKQYNIVIENALAQQVPEGVINKQIAKIKDDGIILASELKSFSAAIADQMVNASKKVKMFLKSIGMGANSVSTQLAKMSEQEFAALLDTSTIQDPEKRAKSQGYESVAKLEEAYKDGTYKFSGAKLPERVQKQLGITKEQFNAVFGGLDDKQIGDVLTAGYRQSKASQNQKDEEEPDKERAFQINLGKVQAEIVLENKLAVFRKGAKDLEIAKLKEIGRIQNDNLLTEDQRAKEIAQATDGYDQNIQSLQTIEQKTKNIEQALIDSVASGIGINESEIASTVAKIQSKLPEFNASDLDSYIASVKEALNSSGITLDNQRAIVQALIDAEVVNNGINAEQREALKIAAEKLGIELKTLDTARDRAIEEAKINSMMESAKSLDNFNFEKQSLDIAYDILSVNQEIEKVKRDSSLNELEKAKEIFKLEEKRVGLEQDKITIDYDKAAIDAARAFQDRVLSTAKGEFGIDSRMISGSLSGGPEAVINAVRAKIPSNDQASFDELIAAQRADYERNLTLAERKRELDKSGVGPVLESDVQKRAREGFSGGMKEGVNKLQDSINTFEFDIAEKIPQMFSDNMSSAINKMIEGGESFGDVLQGAAYEFVKGINQANIQNLSNKFSNFLFKSDGGAASGIESAASSIGSMLGFASGGKVSGGSGSKDDVPAMLMGGEYVVNKKAVSKYGPKFLEAINNGTLNGYAKGGKIQGGNAGFYTPGTYNTGAILGKRDLLSFATQSGTSGVFDKVTNENGYQSIALEPESPMLSVSGMRNSPQFEATQSAKQQAFDLYLQQYNAEREAKKQAEEQKKALTSQLLMLVGSAALGGIGNAASSGAKAALSNLPKDAGFFQKFGTVFSGAIKGGKAGGQQVGGLSNLFGSVGKAFSGDFSGAVNQFKLSQIGNRKQLLSAMKNEKFAAYINQQGGISSKTPFVSDAAGISLNASRSGGVSLTQEEFQEIAKINAEFGISGIELDGISLSKGMAKNKSGFNIFKSMSKGMKGIGSIFSGAGKTGFSSFNSGFTSGPYDKYGNYVEDWADNPSKWNIKQKATGGMIPSTSGIDTVPAMLSGGEFVMNRSAVQGIGAPNLQSMNSGGTSITSEETSKELNEKLLAKLDELIGASGSTGNITINVAPSGQTSQENSQDPSASRQQLARQIKDAVLQIINDEKRIGGTLRR